MVKGLKTSSISIIKRGFSGTSVEFTPVFGGKYLYIINIENFTIEKFLSFQCFFIFNALAIKFMHLIVAEVGQLEVNGFHFKGLLIVVIFEQPILECLFFINKNYSRKAATL